MIATLLRHIRWRILSLFGIAFVLYLLEPGFHTHDQPEIPAIALGPLGVSATLAYFAGLAMIVLLAGFISTDRREGYNNLFFSHPTSPLSYYSLRWSLAFVLSVGGATLFLVVGQLVAWRALLGGWIGLALPILAALIWGALMAFFSAVLSRGATAVVFLLFLPTFFPQLLSALDRLAPPVRQVILLLLPPHGALQRTWEGILVGPFAWDAMLYATGYSAVLLAAAALIVHWRDLA